MVSRAEVTTFGWVQLRFTESIQNHCLFRCWGEDTLFRKQQHPVREVTFCRAAVPGYAGPGNIPKCLVILNNMDPTVKRKALWSSKEMPLSQNICLPCRLEAIFKRGFGVVLTFCSWQHAHLVVTTSLSLEKMPQAMWLSSFVCRRSVCVVWICSSFLIAGRTQEIWALSVFRYHFLMFGCPYIHLSVEVVSPKLALAIILQQVLCSHCSGYGCKIMLFVQMDLSAICTQIFEFQETTVLVWF